MQYSLIAEHHLTRLHYTMLPHYWKYVDSLSQLRLLLCTAPWVLQVGRSNYSARCFMLDSGEETSQLEEVGQT